jgi:uncharacterized membrane protein YgaE (UPF0421/DUF939 family)
MADTAIGVIIALLINLLLPRERIEQIRDKFSKKSKIASPEE